MFTQLASRAGFFDDVSFNPVHVRSADLTPRRSLGGNRLLYHIDSITHNVQYYIYDAVTGIPGNQAHP